MRKIVCPNCGSQQIEYASLISKSTKTITGLGIPEMYYCPNCGYEGPVILEIDQHHLKKAHFQEKNYNKKIDFKAPTKHSQEVLKPVFTIVIMLFLFITALAFWPMQSDEVEYYTQDFEPIPKVDVPLSGLTKIGVMDVPSLGGAAIVEKTPTGEVIIEVHKLEIPQMNVESGLEGVTGFFFPLFVIVFVLGFMGLMLAKHYERSLKFI